MPRITLVLILLSIGMIMGSAFGGEINSDGVTLQEAIEARTNVTLLAEEVADPRAEVRRLMRRELEKAKAHLEAANTLLAKGEYDKAIKAFAEVETLYRRVLEGSAEVERMAEAQRKAEHARVMASVVVEGEQAKSAERELINAEGYVEAGEIEEAIKRYEAASEAYKALLVVGATATLQQAVEARTAMIVARQLVKNLPPEVSEPQEGPSPPSPHALHRRGLRQEIQEEVIQGLLMDLLSRARRIENAAGEALRERDYTSAQALFAHAERLYLDAVARQARIDEIIAKRTAGEEAMQVADASFETEGRPVSFERGKLALEDGQKALMQEDLEKAGQLFDQAVEQFGKARTEAATANALTVAQERFIKLLANLDKDTLTKYALDSFTAAQTKASEARKASAAGQLETAKNLYEEAASGLILASSQALTQRNVEKAAPIVEHLEEALARKDKFASEDILAELEAIIPMDERMAGLKERVSALPGPEKELSIDLGGGIILEMVLIRPGRFTMGSKEGPTDEKPPHEVRFDKPFYIGRYEVTQAQWEAVMGSNPSHFMDPNRPVEQVSWDDAQEFLGKLEVRVEKSGFRLPTEAEWEYACRAGNKLECGESAECLNPYICAECLNPYGWFNGNSEKKTHPSGKKKPNAWGLYDMHGNVAEWCQDWYQEYFYTTPEAVEVNPVCTNTASGARILRGGRWNEDAAGCRCARRNGDHPDRRCFDTGLRVVCSP